MTPTSSDEGLGQLLLKYSGSSNPKSLILLLVIIGLTVTCIAVLFSEKPEGAFPVLVLDIGCFYVWLSDKAKAIECYELGITLRKLRSIDSFFYSEVSAVKYFATHHYFNGVYTGTETKFSLLPRKVRQLNSG